MWISLDTLELGETAFELALKASARCWEMVEDAPIVADGKASKHNVSEKEVTDGKASKHNVSEKEVMDGKPSNHNIRLVARMQFPSSMHRNSRGASETSLLGELEL